MEGALLDACNDLALGGAETLSPVCVSYALLKLGVQPEEVSRLLSWQDFERLTAAILQVSGFEARRNVVLTKPRAQLDVVAKGTSLILSIDCKHYSRGHGPASLRRFALAQLARSKLFRMKLDDKRPIASVVLTMSEPEGRFVDGVAVVPIRTLRSFLTTIDSYTDLLDLK